MRALNLQEKNTQAKNNQDRKKNLNLKKKKKKESDLKHKADLEALKLKREEEKRWEELQKKFGFGREYTLRKRSSNTTSPIKTSSSVSTGKNFSFFSFHFSHFYIIFY